MAKGKARDSDGPTNNQLRGLTYNQNKPKFLQNAMTALSGPSAGRNNLQDNNDGRPPIPTRPRDNTNGDNSDDDVDKLDERDAEDELPQVIVLDEKKHLTGDEAKLAEADAPPVNEHTSQKAAKRGASLRFSSSNGKQSAVGGGGTKRKIYGAEYDEKLVEDDADGRADVGEGFDDLVKRAKVDPLPTNKNDAAKAQEKNEDAPAVQRPKSGNNKAANTTATQKESSHKLSKDEKATLKQKRKAAKKLLSFED